jgi:hypothetical protein
LKPQRGFEDIETKNILISKCSQDIMEIYNIGCTLSLSFHFWTKQWTGISILTKNYDYLLLEIVVAYIWHNVRRSVSMMHLFCAHGSKVWKAAMALLSFMKMCGKMPDKHLQSCSIGPLATYFWCSLWAAFSYDPSTT